MGITDKTYSLFADGVKFAEKLTVNGNNYVSNSKVDTESLPDVFKLEVKDSKDKITEVIDNARLLQQVQYTEGGEYYLAFSKVSKQELLNDKLQSNIEYLAMMANVDIDS